MDSTGSTGMPIHHWREALNRLYDSADADPGESGIMNHSLLTSVRELTPFPRTPSPKPKTESAV
jgi:hypothetical protein